jgi:nucleoside-diphosphate-sugar epimerase
MHIVITGAAGFLGSRLARQLLDQGTLTDRDGAQRNIERITLLDLAPPLGFNDPRVHTVTGDIADPATIARAIEPDTDGIFHLAAVVSGQAEADFDLGMKVNLDATRHLLERARNSGKRPVLVFTSSVAVFGGDLPPNVPDNMKAAPQSSYGTQKAMCELLINDYSRRGYIDGRVLRMPTISVRPGAPNQATSSFASGIIREPLNGQQAVCPVSGDTRMWLMSPDTAVRNLIHAHGLPESDLAAGRVLNLPGLSVTVSDMVDALEQVAGTDASRHIAWEEDEVISRIVRSWPGNFEATRARTLGFTADNNFAQIVRDYMRDYVRVAQQ